MQYIDSIRLESGVPNNSLLFDGVDEWGNVGTAANLDFERTDTFSFTGWLKVESTGSGARRIFGKFRGTKGYSFYISGADELVLDVKNNGGTNGVGVRTTAAITNDAWVHVAGTYDGSSTAAGINLYFDAVLQTDSTDSDNLTLNIAQASEPAQLAAARNGAGSRIQFFNGNIDYLTIWDKELSGAEVTEAYNLDCDGDINTHSAIANVISHYEMGEGDTVPTITDQVGSNDITLNNMEAGDIVNDTNC